MTANLPLVFVAIGSNVGNSCLIVANALRSIAALKGTVSHRQSRLFQTVPITPIPQRDYLNAVCCFKTELSPGALFHQLEEIERALGKTPKPKNAPRPIDLDLLFYGQKRYSDELLEITHPQWRERLFVLVPLSDLLSTIVVPNLSGEAEQIELNELIASFPEEERRQVSLFNLNPYPAFEVNYA